jgi:hypothetical protein
MTSTERILLNGGAVSAALTLALMAGLCVAFALGSFALGS